jgi:translocation and assembly module TamA
LPRTGARLCALALVLLAAACSGKKGVLEDLGIEAPETAVNYEVVLEGSPDDAVASLVEQSLSSYRLQSDGAPSLAFLRRRAESDVPVLLKILRSQGYYSATAEAEVFQGEPGTAKIVISAVPGPAYQLVQHRLLVEHQGAMAPPPLDAAAFGSPVGGAAVAAGIATAESAAVSHLATAGFPYAQFLGRQGLADPEAATLQVDSRIDAGTGYRYGPLSFAGIETVKEAYLLSYLPWTEGDTFDASQLREYQRRLIATGLFTAATVRPPDEAPPGDLLPIAANLEAGPPRTISGGLRYDTDLGPTVRGAFEHRNLFGANEKFRTEAEVGLIKQRVSFGLGKPQFLRPGQDLVTDLTVLRSTDDAFDSLGVTAFAGIERELSPQWTVGVGGLAEVSAIDDNGNKATASLFGVPGFIAYDGSNDLLNPTDGARLRMEVTPFFGAYDGSDTEFLVLDGKGSVYQALDGEGRIVVAARGRLASILSPDLASIPATRRLYSGGGGSVRGYADSFIGPLDSSNDPTGGRSALEGGVELRARLFGDIGGAIFTEAGSVSKSMFPDFADGVQVAAGLGLRYHSPAGPIRVDVALPVNGRRADDAFQVYFSIGQAF